MSLRGTYEGSSLRLFLYELVVGSGRYQQRYQDTVIELDLNGQLPNLLMVNKHSKFGQLNLTGAYGIKNTISLEGDFNQFLPCMHHKVMRLKRWKYLARYDALMR